MLTNILSFVFLLFFSYASFASFFVCKFTHNDLSDEIVSKISFEAQLCREGHGGFYRFYMKDFLIKVSCNGELYVQAANKESGFIRKADVATQKVRGSNEKKPPQLIQASTPKIADTVLKVKCSRKKTVQGNFFNLPKKSV